MTKIGIPTCYKTADGTKINARANYNKDNIPRPEILNQVQDDEYCNATTDNHARANYNIHRNTHVGDGYASSATFGTSLYARNDEANTQHYHINTNITNAPTERIPVPTEIATAPAAVTAVPTEIATAPTAIIAAPAEIAAAPAAKTPAHAEKANAHAEITPALAIPRSTLGMTEAHKAMDVLTIVYENNVYSNNNNNNNNNNYINLNINL
jgi:hypothetical protein